jgi:signal transduction histidine kinase
MGDQAREKTRPWLAGAGFILLVVSVLVGYTILMVLQNARQSSILPELFQNIAPMLGVMDLILSLLIAVAALLVGQAVVSYGIFTGKPLPRSIFKRQWINTLILAMIIAVIVAGSIQMQLRMVYSLLLAVFIISTFSAFITWRYLSERDRAINQVRPFLTAPKLVQSILMQSSRKSDQIDMQGSFKALVSDILEVDRAIIMPVGSTSALFSRNIFYPDNFDIPHISPEILDELKNDAKHLGVPLQEEEYPEFSWLVPLWSERGIIGMLFLGRKADGSFITQEEIELARAASERLLDISISAELSRMLVDLQEKRLSEQSIIDLHPRRVLHDEVLPALHTAMLQISAGNATKETVIGQLANTHKMISSLLQELPSVYTPQLEKAGFTYVIQQLIKIEFPRTFSAIDWRWTIEDAAVVNNLPILKKEVLYYAFREAVRNAANHASPPVVEEGVQLIVRIKAEREVEITIQDNGKGSSDDGSDTSGSRQGLAIHSTFMALIGGELIFENEPASYARVRLICPLSA